MRSPISLAAAAALIAAIVTTDAASADATPASHNAIRRPHLPRRLDTHPHRALSDPVAERGLLDAFFGRYNGRATWYGVGVTMGACGAWTHHSTRAVALNIGLYGNPNAQSKWCGKKLRITSGGKTSIATVVDCCPTCPGIGDLDMSKILFQDFDNLDKGILGISWSWVGAGAGGGGDDDDDDDDSGNGNGNNQSGHGNSHASSNNHKNNDDDDDDEDAPKPKPKPKPKTTTTKTKTKTKTKTSTSTTSTSTSTSTKTKTKTAKAKSTKSVDSNLSNLGQVISGFQNMALVGQS